MSKEKPHREFFSKEVVLKLYRGFDLSDYESRIAFVKEEAEKVRRRFDKEIFDKNLSNKIAHIYLDAEKYAEAIPYFETVVQLSKAETDAFYLFPIWLLVRCNREIGQFSQAFKWNEKAISLFEFASSFDKLNVLKEYADLIQDSGDAFNSTYKSIIQDIIDDLGFPEKLENPIETIYSMVKTNRNCSRELGKIHIQAGLDQKTKLKLFQEYYNACEMDWYKNHVAEIIERIKQKDKP